MGTLTRRRVVSILDRTPRQEISIRRFRPILPLNYQRELHSLARRTQAVGRSKAEGLLDDEIVKAGEYCSGLLASGLKREVRVDTLSYRSSTPRRSLL